MIAVGSVVRLKTGGPNMTVERVVNESAPDKLVDCVWFEYVRDVRVRVQRPDGDWINLDWSGPHRDSFAPAMLEVLFGPPRIEPKEAAP